MQWFLTEPPVLEWLQIFYRIKMAENGKSNTIKILWHLNIFMFYVHNYLTIVKIGYIILLVNAFVLNLLIIIFTKYML